MLPYANGAGMRKSRSESLVLAFQGPAPKNEKAASQMRWMLAWKCVLLLFETGGVDETKRGFCYFVAIDTRYFFLICV